MKNGVITASGTFVLTFGMLTGNLYFIGIGFGLIVAGSYK